MVQRGGFDDIFPGEDVGEPDDDREEGSKETDEGYLDVVRERDLFSCQQVPEPEVTQRNANLLHRLQVPEDVVSNAEITKDLGQTHSRSSGRRESNLTNIRALCYDVGYDELVGLNLTHKLGCACPVTGE